MKVEKVEKPKVLGVFKELDLIAQEVHIKLGGEHPAGDSEFYVVEGDPDVTETMTCSDMACLTTEAKFPGKLKSFQIRCVLPRNIRLADEVKTRIRRQAK